MSVRCLCHEDMLLGVDHVTVALRNYVARTVDDNAALGSIGYSIPEWSEHSQKQFPKDRVKVIEVHAWYSVGDKNES